MLQINTSLCAWQARINIENLKISSNSVLILEGNVLITSLNLNGCLVAKSSANQKVIEGKQVSQDSNTIKIKLVLKPLSLMMLLNKFVPYEKHV